MFQGSQQKIDSTQHPYNPTRLGQDLYTWIPIRTQVEDDQRQTPPWRIEKYVNF
jgi:hypothetical protein